MATMMTPRILMTSKSSTNKVLKNDQKNSSESKKVVWKMFPALNVPSFLDQTVEKYSPYPETGESLVINSKLMVPDSFEDNLENGTESNLYEVKHLMRNSTWDVIKYLSKHFVISKLTLYAGNQIVEDSEVKYNTRATLIIKNVNLDSFLTASQSFLNTNIHISPSSCENEFSLSNLPAWTVKNDVLRHFRQFGKVKYVVMHYGITPDRLQFQMKYSNSANQELTKNCTVNGTTFSITRVTSGASNHNGVESKDTDSDAGKRNLNGTMVEESPKMKNFVENSVSCNESPRGIKRPAEEELQNDRKTLKLRNIPYTISIRSIPRKEWRKMLREAFLEYGDIKKIFTKSIKGGLLDGFVIFSTENAKSDAMKSSTVTLSNGITYKVTSMEESDISKGVPKAISSTEEDGPNTIIVQGIRQFNCREKVRKVFSQIGNIENLEIAPSVGGVTDAYVTFSSKKDMLSALQKKSLILSSGETVKIVRYKKNMTKSVVQPNVIFVHGLPAFCECSHLKNTFARFGKIKHMFVWEGIAKIEFKFDDSSSRVLRTEHIDLFGSAADVRESDEDLPPSFRIAYDKNISERKKVLAM